MNENDEFLAAIEEMDTPTVPVEFLIPSAPGPGEQTIAILIEGISLRQAARRDLQRWLKAKEINVVALRISNQCGFAIMYVDAKQGPHYALYKMSTAIFAGAPITAKLFEGVTPQP